MLTSIPDPEHYSAGRSGTVFVRFQRGVIRGTGTDRLDLLHRLSTNAVGQLQPGEEAITILSSDKGRVVEVPRVLAFSDHLLMVLLGDDVAGVRAWLDKYTIMDDFTTADATAEVAVIGVYGEQAKSQLAAMFGIAPPDAGTCAVSETGVIILRDARLNGAGAFLLLVPTADLPAATQQLHQQGIAEINPETWHTLRIEAGQPWVGAELSQNYNPLEAGLSQFISWTKGCYIGQEIIARLDTYDKVQRHLMGMVLEGLQNGVMENAAMELEVHDPVETKKIGNITSLTASPAIGKRIALAYIRTQYAIPGYQVELRSVGEEGGVVGRGELVSLPFSL
ncbi:MAG: aminomethyltransferase family protein [Armatimonadetes bacterium]|nr:aminomethyltransferase family protein [Armatimonadota bacterium]